jgi:hypothetical protein
MIKHGGRKTRLYNIWHMMRQRCWNPKASKYKNYGGKGVTITPEWNDFVVFRDWAMANGYDDTKQIDRIRSAGNYEPGNCQWLLPAAHKKLRRET